MFAPCEVNVALKEVYVSERVSESLKGSWLLNAVDLRSATRLPRGVHGGGQCGGISAFQALKPALKSSKTPKIALKSIKIILKAA